MLLIAIAVWWTFAVVALVIMIQDSSRDIVDRALIVGLGVFWPLCAVAVLPVLIYQGLVASTARIRVDLKNRGIIAEFEQWLDSRDKGTVLEKEEQK